MNDIAISTIPGVQTITIGNETIALALFEGTLVVNDFIGVNHAPVAGDDTATVDENGVVTINALANDTDMVESTALTITAFDAVGGLLGRTILQDSTGALVYTPVGQDSLAAGQSVTDTFTYTVIDGIHTDTATVPPLFF